MIPFRTSLRRSLAGALCLGMVIAEPAKAQQSVLVLSGEHADFSRLALVLPAPGGWQVSPVPGGYMLRLTQPDVVLDSSRVFDLIPRTRIENLQDGRDSLFLAVSCDCHIRSFEDRPGVLVVDVVSGPDPSSAATSRQPPPRPGTNAGLTPGPAAPEYRQMPARTLTGLGAARTWSVEAGLSPAASTTMTNARPGEPEASVTPDTGAMRTALIAQIGRAATQDILQIAAGAPPEQSAPPTTPAAAPNAPVQEPEAGGIGLNIGTVFDRQGFGTAPTPMTARGKICIPDARLALANWGTAASPWDGLSAARRELVGEFDVPHEGAVLDLARTYLHLGFGAEARATLNAFPELEIADRALLETLALLLDDELYAPGPLAGMADCDTAAALWALLALPAIMPEEAIDTAAVLRSFSALPAHLRLALGGRLAERLMAAGLDGAARSVAAALARAPTGSGETLDLIEARLQLPTDVTGAAEQLTAIAKGNAPESAEALVLLVDANISQGSPVAPDIIEIISARAFELRGTALGTRLEMAHALALGSSGAFDLAFDIAGRITDAPGTASTGDALAEAVFHPLLLLLAETADDATFLQHALGMPFWQTASTPSALRIAVARRLLDLGLPETALAALPERARAPAAETLLRAEALLRAGQPAAALPLLATMTDSRGAALRAGALSALGNAPAAVAALSAVGAQDAAASIAWRAGDPVLIAEHGSDLQRSLLPAAAAPSVDGETGPLASGRALIEQSAALRASINTILMSMPPP